MLALTTFIFGFALVRLTWSMYYLTNFHADYPHARVIVGNCGDTVSLSCNINIDNVSLPVLTMWFRLYENAYPQPLILGDRQLIDDQRFMLRTQHQDRHLEIIGVRKEDQGYYLCKTGNDIQASYNLTILSNSCIDIVPDQIYVTTDEPLQLTCRIRSSENHSDNNKIDVQWTRNNRALKDGIDFMSNYSFTDGIQYDVLLIQQVSLADSGSYECRYGELLSATATVIVNQYPGGSKSRRLISQLRGNSSSSKGSLRTVDNCFYIVYTMVFVTLVVLS